MMARRIHATCKRSTVGKGSASTTIIGMVVRVIVLMILRVMVSLLSHWLLISHRGLKASERSIGCL